MSQEKQTQSVRVWQNLDIESVKKKLLLIDDMYGACGTCRQIGLNYLKDKKCPSCGADFQYLATNLKNPADVSKILNRIRQEGLTFTLIDREDFERASARDSIGGLFKE